MDNETKQHLRDWLQFFRDLGIEDVYQREIGNIESQISHSPGTGSGMSALNSDLSDLKSQISNSATAGHRTSTDERETETRVSTPRLQVQAEANPRRPPTIPSPGTQIPAPPPQSLSLFEAASPTPVYIQETLEEIRKDLGDCRRCKLWGGRKHIVFGQGNPHAELVFVGEGPGADEDEQGFPFVGRAGQLLNRMLQLTGFKREDVYICNVVKCRPPGNRTPETDEISACSPFLFRQIQAIHPRLVCCLGAPAARTVLGIKEGITKVHGRLLDYGNAKAMATVHPAYVLRNMREEIILREDFQKIREFLKQAH